VCSSGSDSLLITHPFHPLAGARVVILFERTYKDAARGRVYICEGGPLGTVTLPEHFTDRGIPPATGPVTREVLLDLVAVISALRRRLTPDEGGPNLVS
jgi:hypothetical protein